MKSVKDATLSGAKWGAIEKFSVQGIRFVLSLIMARLLAPDAYGQVSMIMIFIVISDTLVDSGFSNALIRKKDHSEADFSTVFYCNLAISVFCYICLFFLAPCIAEFFDMPILKSLLRVQSVSVIINAFLAVQVARLTINLNFSALAKCNLFASIFSGILGVLLAY
ncbi:MAG: oligosaccharide flippase family protein, partial [Muribaculaceae bacterium]|nr:oligosaccharide flippase family protein [Muribaculaceae bacterium]